MPSAPSHPRSDPRPSAPLSAGRAPRLHVIVVLHNHARWIRPCLSSLAAQTLAPFQITVFDNASIDEGAEIVAREFPEVRLMRSPRNLGFAGGNNRAAGGVRDADALLLLNPDTVMARTALERLADALASHPDIGVMGCKVLEGDVETIQHVGVTLRGNGLSNHVGQGEPDRGQYRGVRESLAVLGAAMAIRSTTWCELGGLDERFWPGYYEETDFCLRAWAAQWRVAVACEAVVTHFDSSAAHRRDPRFLEMFFRGRARLLLKHYTWRDWLTRYLPDEARWLRFWGSKGMRRIALRTLFEVATGRVPTGDSE